MFWKFLDDAMNGENAQPYKGDSPLVQLPDPGYLVNNSSDNTNQPSDMPTPDDTSKYDDIFKDDSDDNGFWGGVRKLYQMAQDNLKLGETNSLSKVDNSQGDYTSTASPSDNLYNYGDSLPIKLLDRAGQKAADVITNGGALNDQTYDTGNDIANNAADIVGTGLGFMENLPGLGTSTGSLLDKTIGNPVENTLKDIGSNYGLDNKLYDYATQALKTGTEFGAYQGLSNAAQGKDAGEGVAEGMGTGLLFGAGGKLAGDLFHMIPGIGKVKPIADDGSKVTFQDENGNVQDMNKTIYDNTAQVDDTIGNPLTADQFMVDTTETPTNNFKNNVNNNVENNLQNDIQNNSLTDEEINMLLNGDEAGQFKPRNTEVPPVEEPFKVSNSNIEMPNLSDNELNMPIPENNNQIPIDLQRHGANIDLNLLNRRGKIDDENLFKERTGKSPEQSDYKERQTIANSFMNSDAIPQQVKDSLAKDPTKYQYLEHNNEQAMMKARDAVEKNFDGAVGKITNLKSLEDDADTATAIEIERKYIENGEYDKARDWSLKVAKLGTKSGQAIQYFSTIKRMTPEWTLNRASKIIDSAVTDKQRKILNNAPSNMVDEIAKKNKIPHLSEETTKKIIDMSNKIQDMPEGRMKREAIANLNDTIQSEIPVSILDKINSAQTLSMLSGTKTPIRNIIGNTLFKAVDNLKEVPRTLIDMPLSLFTKERTATLPSLGAQIKGYGAGTKEAFLDLKNDVNTKDINDKFELNRRVTWDKNGNLINKAMHQAERVNRFALDDRPAMQSAYEGEMARQRKLSKINGTEFDETAAKEKATLKALHDTFNDDTAISDLVTNLKRNANIAGNSILTGNGIGRKLDQATKDEFAKWGAGDLLVKFAKVPANIVARQVEYSPMSLVSPFVNALRGAIKHEKFDQDYFADTLAKGMTGTGIMGLGAMLHNVLTTDSDKNKNKAELDKESGLGSFKMNLSALQRMLSGEDTKVQKGDKIVSYDWANPISVLMAAGASMAKAKDGKDVKGVGRITGDLIDALNEGVNSVIEQPMNQGLKTWIQQGDLMGGLTQVMGSLPQTFIPSLVNQFRQLSDNTTRETYDPNIFKQGLNQLINRIPGLENQLPQKVDLWGNGKETFQNDSNNPLNVFLNPAISTQYLPTPETEKALSLYDKTANSSVLPKLADKTIDVDGKKVKLTPDQFIQLQSTMGQGAKGIYDNILSDSDSNKLAKDTAKALSDNTQDAKINVLQSNNLPLPLSVTKDELSKDLYKKRSTESKAIRDKIKEINDSDMTTDEKKKAMEDLRPSAQSAAKKNPPKKRGRKKKTSN